MNGEVDMLITVHFGVFWPCQWLYYVLLLCLECLLVGI